MSATTGAVVGSVVAIQAAQNERIEKQRCEAVIYNYEPQYASKAEMKDYAYCVQKIYPEPMNQTENMVAKGCVLVLLIAFVVGIIYGYKDSHGDWVAALIWGVMAPVILTMGAVVVAVIVSGVGFLFS